MKALLFLLFIGSLVAFVGAMFKPTFFVRWGQRTRKGAFAYLGAAFLALVVVAGINGNQPEKAVALPQYKIVKEKTMGNIKRQVDVVLNERVSELELKALAKEIKASSRSYDRLFIFYSIKGESSITAWATTHYNPDLKVVILNGTKVEVQQMKTAPADVEGEVFGRWLSTNGYTCTMTAYKVNGKVFVKSVYGDGSESKVEYTLTNINGKQRLEKPNDFGEYYMIAPNGDLEFWSKNGNYYTANKL